MGFITRRGGIAHIPRRSGARTSSGQATAEFGLVMIVVLGLFLAIVDFGHIVGMHAAAVTASRDGARYGSATGAPGPTDASIPAPSGKPRYAFCEGIRQAARNATAGLITLPNEEIDITYDDGDDGSDVTPASGTSCGDAVNAVADETLIDRFDRVSVAVTIRYSPISPLRVLGEMTVTSTNRRTIMKASTP